MDFDNSRFQAWKVIGFVLENYGKCNIIIDFVGVVGVVGVVVVVRLISVIFCFPNNICFRIYCLQF